MSSVRKKNNIEREERRRAAGLYACSHTIEETSRFFGLSKDIVKYWKAKVLDPDLHAGELGGSRNQSGVLSSDDKKMIDCMIFSVVHHMPHLRLLEIQKFVELQGFDVSTSFISSMFYVLID